MIDTLAISGYRSLRDIVLPIDHLTVITGANGTGKSSVYRALRLLAGVADDRAIAAIAREGGFDSLRWAGPEVISHAMRRGDVPIQGTVRKDPVALKLGYREDGISYSAELGLPPPDMRTLFSRDPEIKVEAIWAGENPTPSKLLARRNGPSLQIKRGGEKQLSQAHTAMRGYESALQRLTRLLLFESCAHVFRTGAFTTISEPMQVHPCASPRSAPEPIYSPPMDVISPLRSKRFLKSAMETL